MKTLMMEKNKLKYYIIYNIFYDCNEKIDNLFVIEKTVSNNNMSIYFLSDGNFELGHLGIVK